MHHPRWLSGISEPSTVYPTGLLHSNLLPPCLLPSISSFQLGLIKSVGWSSGYSVSPVVNVIFTPGNPTNSHLSWNSMEFAVVKIMLNLPMIGEWVFSWLPKTFLLVNVTKNHPFWILHPSTHPTDFRSLRDPLGSWLTWIWWRSLDIFSQRVVTMIVIFIPWESQSVKKSPKQTNPRLFGSSFLGSTFCWVFETFIRIKRPTKKSLQFWMKHI